MIWHTVIQPAAFLLGLSQLGYAAVDANDVRMSPIFADAIEFLPNVSNIVNVSYPTLQVAFKTPNLSDNASMTGFDWTEPFPGSKIDGHKAYMRVAYDVPIPEDIVQNATTAVSSLTFSIPDSMMQKNKNLPKPMDPSWYICRHIFISTKPDSSTPVNHDCDFLGSKCQDDLRSSLTKTWMKEMPNVPCTGLGFDPLPKSCWDTFGYARADVMGFEADVMSDPLGAKLEFLDEQSQYNWRVGTGFHDPGDIEAHKMAANRTYLLVDVWGYSFSADKESRQTPEATLTCLRPVPQKRIVSNTTTATSSTGTATSTKTGSTTASTSTSTGSASSKGKRSKYEVVLSYISLLLLAVI